MAHIRGLKTRTPHSVTTALASISLALHLIIYALPYANDYFVSPDQSQLLKMDGFGAEPMAASISYFWMLAIGVFIHSAIIYRPFRALLPLIAYIVSILFLSAFWGVRVMSAPEFISLQLYWATCGALVIKIMIDMKRKH